MIEKSVGDCMHLMGGFICSERLAHQNYPCPHRNNIRKCLYSIPITEKMAKQWKERGCISLTLKEIGYNPLEK